MKNLFKATVNLSKIGLILFVLFIFYKAPILLLLIGLLAIYMLPSIIAYYKKLPNFIGIFISNLIFGWTFICWLICLTFALTGVQIGIPVVVINQESK